MVFIRNGEEEFEAGGPARFEHMPAANQDIPPFSVMPQEDGTYGPEAIENLLLEMDRLSEIYEQNNPAETLIAVMTEAQQRMADYIPYSFEKLVGLITCPKMALDRDPAEFFAVAQVMVERISAANTNFVDDGDET